MTKTNPDKLCKSCREFDRHINGTEGSCNDVWVECKCEDDDMAWVKIKEDEIPKNEELLVYNNHESFKNQGPYFVAIYFGNGIWDVINDTYPNSSNYSGFNPTHWMSLKQPKKDE